MGGGERKEGFSHELEVSQGENFLLKLCKLCLSDMTFLTTFGLLTM